MMEDLRFYDFELNLLEIENKFISSNWNIYFNDIGKVEIHLPYTAKSLPLIFDNKYLILAQGEKQAIVTGKQIGKDCVIYGRTPNWILTKRVLLPFESPDSDAETVLREKTINAFSDCDNFLLGNVCSLGYSADLSEAKACSLFDFIKKTADTADAGHRVYFDFADKNWIFEVLKGEKRNILISDSSLTAYDTEYVFDIQNYFNTGFFETEKTSDGDAIYDKTSSEDLTGLYKWETVIFCDNKETADSELSKKEISEFISAKTRNLSWGKDYNLGDTVTLKFERGDIKRTNEAKVDGVNIWDEAGDFGQQPIMKDIMS